MGGAQGSRVLASVRSTLSSRRANAGSAAPGSPVPRGRLLEDRNVQRLLRHHLLQPAVLLLQTLQPAGLLRLQTPIYPQPPVVGPLGLIRQSEKRGRLSPPSQTIIGGVRLGPEAPGAWWLSRSSKPLLRADAAPGGGFDSHALPPPAKGGSKVRTCERVNLRTVPCSTAPPLLCTSVPGHPLRPVPCHPAWYHLLCDTGSTPHFRWRSR
jgi:hypothetical protein